MSDGTLEAGASGAAAGSAAGPWGAVIGAGIGMASNMMSNDANSAQAGKNRAFQANMSNTAYRRSVRDMKAAGLNPMLAYQQGGASTPQGAQAQMKSATEGVANTALDSLRVSKELEMQESQIDLLKAQARNANKAANKTSTENTLLERQVPKANMIQEMWQGVKKVFDTGKNSAKSLNKKIRPKSPKAKKAVKQFKNSWEGYQPSLSTRPH